MIDKITATNPRVDDKTIHGYFDSILNRIAAREFSYDCVKSDGRFPIIQSCSDGTTSQNYLRFEFQKGDLLGHISGKDRVVTGRKLLSYLREKGEKFFVKGDILTKQEFYAMSNYCEQNKSTPIKLPKLK